MAQARPSTYNLADGNLLAGGDVRPKLVLTSGQSSAPLLVEATGWSVTNTGNVPAPWAASAAPGDVAFGVSGGRLAPAASVNIGPMAMLVGLKTITLSCPAPGAVVTPPASAPFTGTSSPTPPPPPPSPTLATLSGSNSATVDVAHADVVTLDAPATVTTTVTWARSDGATGPATSTIAIGQTATSGATSTWGSGAVGAQTVDFTISPSITRAGRPLSVTVSGGSPPPPPPPASAPGGFSLTSATSGTLPFTVGMAFEQGAIPSGSGIAISGATAQAAVKSTWPDGSKKFAIIAGTYTSAGSAVAVTPSAGAASSGTALTTADLIAALSHPMVFDAGAFGLASFGSTEWAAPFEAWVSGHRMSSWIYRKAIGSDAHLVAWLEVRLYLGGAVEVLPWVENGMLLVASPGQRSATYTFTMGGTQRFSAAIDLLHHQRTPLISGSMLSYWHGMTDPGVTVVHDTDYMQRTGLVPAYHAKTPAGAAALVGYDANPAIVTSFTPLQLGNFTNGNGMTGGGFSNHIGLLPEWDAVHLTHASAVTYKGVIFNGYSFGRFGTHHRDEGDNYRPVRLSQRPTLNLAPPSSGWTTTPATSGTDPPGWGSSHHPSAGYLAYLITGRRYFLDEVQFVASYNAMGGLTSTNRESGLGLYKSQVAGNERHVAWCLRSLAQAIAITPDSDTTALTEFRTQYQNNMGYYHTRYIGAGGPSAPIFNNGGFVQPSSDVGNGGTGTFWVTIWMQDFITASLGYAKDLGLGLDSTGTTRLNEFFAWKAQGTVGRFGGVGATEYLYRDYGPYYLPIAPTDTPNWTDGSGPWCYNAGNGWGDIYAVTWSGTNPPDGPNVPYTPPTGGKVLGSGTLRQWYYQNSGPIAALPALAYAKKHGISGAALGWARLTSGGNWYSMQADLDAHPLWGIAPSAYPRWEQPVSGQISGPTWVQVAGSSSIAGYTPANTARQVNGTAAAGAPRWEGYCGLSISLATGDVFSPANGGHGDYYGNENAKLSMAADAPVWTEQFVGSSGNVIPASPVDVSAYYNDDGINGRLPPSAHSYYSLWPITSHNTVVRIGDVSISPTGSGWVNTEAINTAAAQGVKPWLPQYVYPAHHLSNAGTPDGLTTGIGQAVCQDPRNEKIYSMGAGGFRVFTPSSTPPTSSAGSGGSWANMVGPSPGFANNGPACAVDTRRGRILAFSVTAAAGATYHVYDIDGGAGWVNGSTPAGTFTGAGVATINAEGQSTSHGLTYDPVLDCFILFLGYAGSPLFKIDASAAVGSFTLVPLTTSGGSAIPFTYMRGQGLTNVEAASAFAGVYNRAQYINRFRGVLYLPRISANAWLLRTH